MICVKLCVISLCCFVFFSVGLIVFIGRLVCFVKLCMGKFLMSCSVFSMNLNGRLCVLILCFFCMIVLVFVCLMKVVGCL